jgi:hypothetical protein
MEIGREFKRGRVYADQQKARKDNDTNGRRGVMWCTELGCCRYKWPGEEYTPCLYRTVLDGMACIRAN